MRPTTAIAVLAAASLAVGTFAAGCNSGTTSLPSSSSVWFGPGSSPNTGVGYTAGGSGGFAAGGTLQEPLMGHKAVVLTNGNVLVVGGWRADPALDPNNIVTESQIYDTANDSWQFVSALPQNAAPATSGYLMEPTGNAFPTRRTECAVASMINGDILISGGVGAQRNTAAGAPRVEFLDTAYRFTPASGTFTIIPTRMPIARCFHLSRVLSNGDVLVTAGVGIATVAGGAQLMQALLQADVFSSNNGWTTVAAPMGGGHTWGNIEQLGNSALIYGGLFVDAAAPPQGQQPIGLVVRGIGLPLVAPASPNSQGAFPGAIAELFDPTNPPAPGQAFSNAPFASVRPFPMGTGILCSGSTTLATGDVFFAGGETLTAGMNQKDAGAIFTTEIVRLATNNTEAGPDMGSSLPPLPNGLPATLTALTETECGEVGNTSDVLIIGGHDGAANPTTQAERWSYLRNYMVGVVDMAEARSGHCLAKLPGSRLLVIGGLGAPPQREGRAPPSIPARSGLRRTVCVSGGLRPPDSPKHFSAGPLCTDTGWGG